MQLTISSARSDSCWPWAGRDVPGLAVPGRSLTHGTALPDISCVSLAKNVQIIAAWSWTFQGFVGYIVNSGKQDVFEQHLGQ